MTQADQIFIIIKHRIIFFQSFFYIDLLVTVRKAEPWLAGCKSCIFAVIPLHRNSGIVTALVPYSLAEIIFRDGFVLNNKILVCVTHLDILVFIQRELYICHTDLLTLIYIRSSLHAVENSSVSFCTFLTVSGIISPSGDHTWLVMIFEVQSIPAFIVKLVLPLRHNTFQITEIKRLQCPLAIYRAWNTVDVHMLKCEDHIQLLTLRICKQSCNLRCGARRLTYRHTVIF